MTIIGRKTKWITLSQKEKEYYENREVQGITRHLDKRIKSPYPVPRVKKSS